MATRSLDTSHDWTVARLHALPDDGNRYEIIDGVLHVTPSPTSGHQWALQELFLRLLPYARAIGLDVMMSPADLQYSERTVVQPDLFAFHNPTGTAPRSWTEVQPLLLAVEIVSPSSRRRDRGLKRQLFQTQGVREYWVVDAARREIERATPESEQVELLAVDLIWQPDATSARLVLDLREFFNRVAGD